MSTHINISNDEGAQKYIEGQLEGLQREINFSFNGNYEKGYIAEKLRNIARTYDIELDPEKSRKMPATDLAEEHELTDLNGNYSAVEFFEYIVESIINGQKEQAKKLIAEMDNDSIRNCHSHFEIEHKREMLAGRRGIARQYEEAKKMIIEHLTE